MKNTLTLSSLPLQLRWKWGVTPSTSLVGCLSDSEDHDHLIDRQCQLIWDPHTKTQADVEREGRFWYLYGAFHYPLPGIYQPMLAVDDQQIKLDTRIIVGDPQQRWISSILYSTFGGTPSQAECRYYDHLLKKGLSHGQLVQELLHSWDWYKKQVEACYHTILHRRPNVEETQLGIGTIQESGSTLELRKKLYLSDEFSPDGSMGFIDALVENAVDDAALRPYLRHQLQRQVENGQSKGHLTALALRSTPVALSLLDSYYRQLAPGSTAAMQTGDALALWQQKGGEQGLLQNVLTRQPIDHSPLMDGPDIILQLIGLLSLIPQDTIITFEGYLQSIATSLKTQLDQNFPNSNIAPNPEAQLIPWGSNLNGGIWFNSPGMAAEDQALEGVNIPLPQPELIAIQFTAQSINTAMEKFWQAAPKRYDTNGNADPNGAIYVTGYSLEMANKTATLNIKGYQPVDKLKITFTITYKDVLSLDNNGHIQVQSTSSINIDDLAFIALETIFTIFTPPPFDSLPLEYISSKLQSGEAALTPPPLPTLGPLLQQNFNVLILVPMSTKKIDFVYDLLSLDETNGFIVAGSQLPLVNRDPSVTITGKLYVFENDPAVTWKNTGKPGSVGPQLTYGIITQDMRPPLTVEWTIAGVNSPGNPALNYSITTVLQFTIGKTQTKQISVKVTDADNQVVTAYFGTTYLGTQQLPTTTKPPGHGIITTQTIPVG